MVGRGREEKGGGSSECGGGASSGLPEAERAGGGDWGCPAHPGSLWPGWGGPAAAGREQQEVCAPCMGRMRKEAKKAARGACGKQEWTRGGRSSAAGPPVYLPAPVSSLGGGEGAELRTDADAWKWMRSVLDKRGETWLPGAYPEALAGQARPKRQCVCHESATIGHPRLSR